MPGTGSASTEYPVLTRGFTRILLLTDSGVTLWDDCDNTIISNNMIKNGTSDGIFVWGANSPTYTRNVTVTGNTVSNKATGWGISVRFGEG
jgi:parallel beta-helix repeat protein